MRCPDCGVDYPVKPEVVVKKEPCECGVSEDVRITTTAMRCVALCVSIIVLSCSSCTIYQIHVNAKIAEKGDRIAPNGTLEKK